MTKKRKSIDDSTDDNAVKFIIVAFCAITSLSYTWVEAAAIYKTVDLLNNNVAAKAAVRYINTRTGRSYSTLDIEYVFSPSAGNVQIGSDSIPAEDKSQIIHGSSVNILYDPHHIDISEISYNLNRRWISAGISILYDIFISFVIYSLFKPTKIRP